MSDDEESFFFFDGTCWTVLAGERDPLAGVGTDLVGDVTALVGIAFAGDAFTIFLGSSSEEEDESEELDEESFLGVAFDFGATLLALAAPTLLALAIISTRK